VSHERPGVRFAGSWLALMFAVKRRGAVERSLGGKAGNEKGFGCAELGAERETTVDQTLIRGLVTAFLVFVSAFLGLEDGRRARAQPHN
jgi:hypothetical protein